MRGPYLIEPGDIDEVRKIMYTIGPEQAGMEHMLKKSRIYPLYLKDVKSPAANILKQQMLSLGGEAVVGKWVVNMSREESDVLLLGTLKQYRLLIDKLVCQPWGLKELSGRIKLIIEGLDNPQKRTWNWPGQELAIGDRVLVMGILNITPDSFSDGGKFFEPKKALEQARKMVADGADIIDVGGESTRPSSVPVSLEEELNRVMPVLELLLKEINVPISVDTYKAQTAREALALGVHIINDVGGGKKDLQMAKTAAEHDTPVIIMHNKKRSSEVPHELAADVIDDLAESIKIYEEAGLNPKKIMIDPGIGFGKNTQGNLALMKSLESLKILNRPILLGASRKSFIGAVLDTPVEDRVEGSLAAVAWGVMKGVSVVRVHDVKETVRLVRMLEAVKKAGERK